MKEIFHQLQNKRIRQITKGALLLLLHVAIPFMIKEFLNFHIDEASPGMTLEGYSLPAISFYKESSWNKLIFFNLFI